MRDQLPIGWTCVTPPDLASPERYSLSIGPFGSDLKVSDYCDHGVPLVFVRNIRGESFDDNNPKFVSRDKAAQLTAHEVHPGDVLITKMGEPPGDSALYPMSRPIGVITADCVRWKVDPEVGDARYLVYATRSPHVREQILGITRGVAQRKVSLSRFKSITYRLAPLSEQYRIVAAIESYFTRLDDAVATLERVQRNLKLYRASVLKAAVEGRLVPTEAELARAEGRSYEPASVLLSRILAERRRRWEEAELAKMTAKGKAPKDDKWKTKYVEPVAPDTSELPELPEGWCWASCGQILLSLQTGPFGSSLHRSDYVTGGTPVINPQHLQTYGIRPSDRVTVSTDTVARLSAFVLNAGDVVLGRRGEMGRCALVGPREDGWLLGTGSLALRPEEAVDGHFLAWVLRSPRSVRTLVGESVGTTMTNLNQEILLGLAIPLAPTAEQLRVAREIERHFSVIDVLDRAATTQRLRLTRLRQSILKWAFEGRLVDQDPTDEPASVLLERIRAERASATDTSPRRARRPKARAPKS